MRFSLRFVPTLALALAPALVPPVLLAQKPIGPQYHIYAGNTHSHTEYTWSHGAQYTIKPGCAGILVFGPQPSTSSLGTWSSGYVASKANCPTIYVIDGWQYPSPNSLLKPDWRKFQGSPAEHFALAKAHGFDFYAVTDHSQEAAFNPPTPNNPAWLATKKAAAAATDAHFVALAGFEFSENNGPGGTGHINVFNTDGILNALAPGINLPYLYKWLETAKPNGAGPVVASFNHPVPKQYNDWAYRDPKITRIITTLEVINSNKVIHYQGFINALDKGWKVSPISGLDNHGIGAISSNQSRTFVLATAKTKVAILDAMKARRTYASLDSNIQCRYTVNGAIMGSTLRSGRAGAPGAPGPVERQAGRVAQPRGVPRPSMARPDHFNFDIQVSDPDVGKPGDKITRIDIVTDHGVVVMTDVPATPAYAVTWRPTITNTTSKYFFVRVWNAAGGDAPHPDPSKPMAWLAPIWTGR